MLRAGKRNKKVLIQSVAETQDTKGGLTPAWGKFSDAWASVEMISGNEFWSSKQVNASADYAIVTDYIPGVTSKMRVKWGARIFEIVEPPRNTRERNRELVLMCKEEI